LGRTELSVTKLGCGAMEVRGPRIWGGRPIEEAEAERVLDAVIDNGVTLALTCTGTRHMTGYNG
jgi:aryl-alcohol dehydrogenase-like predicted oxidoreductase